MLSVFCFFSPLLRNLSASVLNSSSANSELSFSLSGSTSLRLSRLSSMGTSVRIVARNFDIRMSSAAASIFSLSLPFTSADLLISSSTEPKSLISFTAVFSPTPGHPGKLSALSPIKASRSITCAGLFMPYFSSICPAPIMSYPPPCRGR